MKIERERKRRCSSGREEVVGPLDRRAQRLLARDQPPDRPAASQAAAKAARAAVRLRETAVRAAASSIASGSSSSRAHSSRGRRCRRNDGIDGERAGGEELHCVVLCERWHRPGLLTTDAEPLPARDERRGPSRSRSVARSAAAPRKQMLDVVEHEQRPLPARAAASVSSSGVPGSSLTASPARPRGVGALDRAAARAEPR